MERGEPESLERRLLAEMRRINREIASLEEERQSIRRILLRSRRENVLNKEVARSTSIKRIIIERTIINYLQKLDGKSISTKYLRGEVDQVEPSIKDSTFRSHLHRLKVKGIIESPAHGRWRIVKPST